VNRHFRLYVAVRRLCEGPHGPLLCACVGGLLSTSGKFACTDLHQWHAACAPHISGTSRRSLPWTLLIICGHTKILKQCFYNRGPDRSKNLLTTNDGRN
jgi:hypothetical protein